MASPFELFKVEMAFSEKEVVFKFPYRNSSAWVQMKDEMKARMTGARFKKEPFPHWRADNTGRTRWAIDLLQGKNNYSYYREEIPEVTSKRPELFSHQRQAFSFLVHQKRCILAAEMGTGKTLAVIEFLEYAKPKVTWYVAPRFAIGSIKMMFKSWKAEYMPYFMSYDELRKTIQNWPAGQKSPDCVIFDESAYLKTPNSQRTNCAIHLTENMLREHDDPYIILMSGAPAPKSPKDWWSQCEIACPGFLKESNIYAFEQRLALVIDEMSLGGKFKKLITWWDNEHKCQECGEFEDHPNHVKKLSQKKKEIELGLAGLLNISAEMTCVEHPYVPSKNEVADLYRRMSGLVLVQFKKDVLTHLPDMIYRVVRLEPSAKTNRAAVLINRTATRTVEALTRLRELSDGFQYKQEPSGEFVDCLRCHGKAIISEPDIQGACPNCNNGKVEKLRRIAQRVPCPKDDALRELMTECGNRIVVFGGFTETIDRIVDVCLKEGWDVIRVDGTTRELPNSMWTSREFDEYPLEAFQNKEKYDRVAFVAHAATAKTSLTLTASNMIVYYSNTFNADDRIQSEARIHRIGMDINKGAIIVDLIHLESDMYVRENLRKKRELQSVTLGELQEFMKEALENEFTFEVSEKEIV